jgi:choline transport protein
MPKGPNIVNLTGDGSSKFAVRDTMDEKYQGTSFDRKEMSILGKKQVLRRQFKFSTMLGFASTVMVAWEFVLIVAPFGLTNGGTPAVFWGIVLSPFILLPMYASLAEVASMSPTAGGNINRQERVTMKLLTKM